MSSFLQLLLKLFPRPLLIRISYLVKPLIAMALRGNQFTDPIDNKSYRSFLPYGYGKMRSNVLAPGTFSLERHRLLWLYLNEKTDFFTATKKVLHFAPEQAFYKRFKEQANLDYITTDLHSPLADVKADICQLPFADNLFDVILCNHVLEHITDDTQAMRELFRVLKPGGWAILQIPLDSKRSISFEDPSITDSKQRAAIFGQYDHVRVYGKDYFEKLRKIGFKVVEEDYTATLSPAIIQRYRLPLGEIIPVCFK